jgi:hypothetical protein
MNALLDEAKSADLPDHSKAKASGEYSIPAAGKTLARFVGYVEMGKRTAYYQGKENGTEMKAKLFFELLGPKHMVDDGEGGKRSTLYIEDIAVKTGEKASFRKRFMKMRGGREEITNMAQMVGEGFIIEITHNNGTGDKKDTVYANMRNKEGEWGVSPPMIEDPVTGEVRIVPIPEPTQPYRLLLWSKPSKAQWDSIFIDGTTTKKIKGEDGKEVEQEVSRNWIQNNITKHAIDFESSQLYDLLSGLGELNLDPDGDDGEEHHDEEAVKAAEAEAARIAAEKAAEDKAKADAAVAAKAKAEADAAAVAEAKKEPEQPKEEEKKPAENVDDIFKELGI